MRPLPREHYAPFYCEENVWHLIATDALRGRRLHVVFVSNRSGHCALWAQRAAAAANEPVVWDYHVVLLESTADHEASSTRIWDLDSALGAPVHASEYFAKTFPYQGRMTAALEPEFKLVEAEHYRATFASDRRHMRVPGAPAVAEPPWACIGIAERSHNLHEFCDMTVETHGRIFDLDGLRAWIVREFGTRRST